MVNTKRFETRSDLFHYVATRSQALLSDGCRQNGNASIIVPGGSTPAPAFELLSKTKLPWDKVTVIPSDERWLPPADAQSNEGLIKRTLLINNAAKANLISIYTDEHSPKLGREVVESRLTKLKTPFDVCILGMGNDGHFASLFPGLDSLTTAMDKTNEARCIDIDASGCPVAGEITQRLSLTLSAILNSRLIILLVTGNEKFSVIEKAKEHADFNTLPVSALLQQADTPVEICWAE